MGDGAVSTTEMVRIQALHVSGSPNRVLAKSIECPRSGDPAATILDPTLDPGPLAGDEVQTSHTTRMSERRRIAVMCDAPTRSVPAWVPSAETEEPVDGRSQDSRTVDLGATQVNVEGPPMVITPAPDPDRPCAVKDDLDLDPTKIHRLGPTVTPVTYCDGGAVDPAGVGQAEHTVILSDCNQGGNHPKTGGGSADPTNGATGQDKYPAGVHASNDNRVGKCVDPIGGMREKPDQTTDSTVAGPSSLDPPGVDPSGLDSPEADPAEEEQVCMHEGGDLHAEDVEADMAVLPELSIGADEVAIDDIQVGGPGDPVVRARSTACRI
ncbi:hypothetical protein ON010_g19108 [Phytophthora cinnamomi]|nr:hypothetical protein ON010_g19108 [Phytophthora cinnamomi]